MKPFYVYILHCNDGSYYVGHTDNFERRMTQYMNKQCNGYVAARLPFKIVFVGTWGTRDEAIRVERQIKGWSRKKKGTLIHGGWKAMSLFFENEKRSNPSTSSGRT